MDFYTVNIMGVKYKKEFSIYSEEEKAALCGEIPMTEEIFEKCRNLAFACCDTETIYYLIKN